MQAVTNSEPMVSPRFKPRLVFAFRLLSITAKMDQPTMSSTVAAPTIIPPSSFFSRSRSIRILAMTGRADMDRAVHMNSPNIQNLSGEVLHSPGIRTTIPRPEMKGRNMPDMLVIKVLLLCSHMQARSISRPAVKIKAISPK